MTQPATKRVAFLLPPGYAGEFIKSFVQAMPAGVDVEIIPRSKLGLPRLGISMWRAFSWSDAIARCTHAWRVRRTPEYFFRFVKAIIQAPIYFARHYRTVAGYDAVVIFNGFRYNQMTASMAARDLGVQTIYCELGFFPGTLVFDPRGINYGNSLPRDITDYPPADDEAYNIYKELRARLQARQSTKALEQKAIKLPEKYIFVPFQVDVDSQIAFYSPWIKDMEALYQALEKLTPYLPQGWAFVLKEHPERMVDYSHLRARADGEKMIFANGNDSVELIKNASGLLTINSSMGVQGLLFDYPVITVGQSCYSFPGLAEHAGSMAKSIELIKQVDRLPVDREARVRFVAYTHKHYLLTASLSDPLSPGSAEKIRQQFTELLGLQRSEAHKKVSS